MKKLLLLLTLNLSHMYINAGTSYAAKDINITQPDLTVIGGVAMESLSGVTANIIYALKDELNINFIQTSNRNILQDVPIEVINIVNGKSSSAGKVALLTDIIWHKWANNYELVPENSVIKLAYSMLESDAIPLQWVTALNTHFDAVIVPDPFLEQTYRKSGVTIPIFVLPCLLQLDDLFKQKIKSKRNKIFKFGTSCLINPNKNIEILIEAFSRTFQKNINVELIIHSREASAAQVNDLNKIIKNKKLLNCKIVSRRFNRADYIDFIKQLDCYVSISKGEGFSIIPREALALGIPCILSNNTAQKTICNSGFVHPVASSIKEPAFYDHLMGQSGFRFNCKINDVILSLKSVYYNYPKYLTKAQESLKWVSQYSIQALKNKYVNLIKPKRVLLGDRNIITDDYIETNSKELYTKYLSVINNTQ